MFIALTGETHKHHYKALMSDTHTTLPLYPPPSPLLALSLSFCLSFFRPKSSVIHWADSQTASKQDSKLGIMDELMVKKIIVFCILQLIQLNAKGCIYYIFASAGFCRILNIWAYLKVNSLLYIDIHAYIDTHVVNLFYIYKVPHATNLKVHIYKKQKQTHNQDVDSEAFSQALPEQLVSDLTFPQQPLHPQGFLCTVQPQVSFRSRDAVIRWVCTLCLAEQSLPFHTGAVGYVTHFMAWLRRWCVRAQERRVIHPVGHSDT